MPDEGYSCPDLVRRARSGCVRAVLGSPLRLGCSRSSPHASWEEVWYGHWPSRNWARVTGVIGCPIRRRKKRWPGRWRQCGQLSARGGVPAGGPAELLDGFKRRSAAALLPWRTLSAADRGGRNASQGGDLRAQPTGVGPSSLRTWIVYALVREDGLTQVQAAELLGQHKSWVCRRLALSGERLADEAEAEAAPGPVAAELGAAVDAVARGQPGRRTGHRTP